MSNPTDTQALHAALTAEMADKIQGLVKNATPESKARLRAIKEERERAKARELAARKHAKEVSDKGADSVKFHDAFDRYGAPSGLTLAEFSEIWALRSVIRRWVMRKGKLRPVSEYEYRVEALRKKLSRPPRKNADLSGMTPNEVRQHRRTQNNKSKQKERAEKKAQAERSASAPRIISEDELSYLAEEVAQAPAEQAEIQLLLASLAEAEAREAAAEDAARGEAI